MSRVFLVLGAILAFSGCREPLSSGAPTELPVAVASAAPLSGLREACPWLPAVAPEIELSPQAERELSPARQACQKGEPGACVRLSGLELDGAFVPPRPASVLARLTPLCQAGVFSACGEAGRAAQQLAEHQLAGFDGESVLGSAGFEPERYLAPLTQACEHGVLASCRALNEAPDAASRAATRAALEKACDQGRQPLRCGALARLLLRYQSPELRQRAELLAGPHLDALVSQCQAKQLEACAELVSFKYASHWVELGQEPRFAALAEGYQAPPGTEPAVFKVLELACTAGDRAACTELGASWAVQGFRAKGEPLLAAACDAGDQRGCLELAKFWGLGDPRAKQLLQSACSYGFAGACVTLGRQDAVFRVRACQLGTCDDAAELEPELTCVAAQRGCAKVLERARQPLTAACQFGLLRAACQEGERSSCGELGELYRAGNGTAKDPILAAKALEAACREPPFGLQTYDGRAWCEKLAGYHERGEGVAKDPAKAAWAYAGLCLKGSPGSCDAIERVMGKPFARGVYGPSGVGERRCALLPEGFACDEQQVCRHARLVSDCVKETR